MDVVAAMIRQDGKFLIAKRKKGDSFGGFWEFPGGKVESGETKEKALQREIKEELDVDIETGKLLYSVKCETGGVSLNISLFECKIMRGEPQTIECSEISWAWPDQLKRFEFIPADKKIVQWIEERYGEEY